MVKPLNNNVKHDQNYPTARKIRRSCSREMFRTRKSSGSILHPSW